MKKNTLNKIFFLGFIAIIALACRPKKTIVAIPVAVKTDSVAINTAKRAEQIALLKNKNLQFNTLAIKSKAVLNANGETNNVTLFVRIKKDEKIWISVNATIASIEGFRVLITPDSIFLRNNLQKTYLKKPFSYLYDFTNNQISFKLLQAVLAGNTIDTFLEEKTVIDFKNGVWNLSGNNNNLAYNFLFNALLKPAEISLNDVKAAQAFKVVYTNYQQIGIALFPSSLKINSMAGTKNIAADVNIIKIETDTPLEFPFNVPKSFEVIN